MKAQVLITILSALGAGAVGAVVAGGSGSSAPSDSGSLAAQVAELQGSIDGLRADNDRMLDRLMTLESRPAPMAAASRVDADRPSSAEIAAIQEDLTSLAEAMRDPEAVLPPNFRLQISNVLEDIRAEEEREREEDRKKRDEERKEERIQQMIEELGLNAYQANQLRESMGDIEAKMQAMRDEMRESGDFGGMRDAMEALRTDAKNDFARYMTTEQIATMEEKYLSGRGGIMGFGGRGGFGGGGRGGFGGGGGGRGGRGG